MSDDEENQMKGKSKEVKKEEKKYGEMKKRRMGRGSEVRGMKKGLACANLSSKER